MSLSSQTSKNTYTGNGAVDTYAYGFKIFDDDDLLVTVADTTGAETTLTKTTHYTVTGVGATAGGNVVLVNGAFDWLDGDGDLKSNYRLTIRRRMSRVQSTDLRNQGSYYPEDVENQLDKLVMIDQGQQDEIDRSVKLPETLTTSNFDPEFPGDLVANGASSVPLVNSSGNGWADADEWPTANEISNAQTYATNAATAETNAEAAQALAEAWASKTDGQVAATDYSAKAWAIGGTGVTDTASRGAAKEWAIETASTVDTSEYSAKEYAVGTQRRGAANGGSAKDWATYTGGTVDNASYSAKHWADTAAATVTGKVDKSTLTAKGSIYAASAASTPAELTVGADGTVLTADSAQALGVKWATVLTNPMTTGGDLIYGGASGTPTRLANGSANQYLRSAGGTSAPVWTTFTTPVVTRYTSGSGTHNITSGAKWIRIRMVGGGGGGGGSGSTAGTAATDGGNSTIDTTLLVAGGGLKGAYDSDGGNGGSNSSTAGPTIVQSVVGGRGQGSMRQGSATSTASTRPSGGQGGASAFGGNGGGGSAGTTGVGQAGQPNTGGGGGGAYVGQLNSGATGSGGGAGGYLEAIIASPAASYSYSVGAAGTAQLAGTSGFAGGDGGSGVIIIEEYFQ